MGIENVISLKKFQLKQLITLLYNDKKKTFTLTRINIEQKVRIKIKFPSQLQNIIF